jgi:signal transduction histidine kinase
MTVLPSIQGRLFRAVLGLTLLWALAGAGLVWLVVRAEVEELMDETLLDAADALAQELRVAPPATGGAPVVVGAAARDSHFSWQLVGADGRLMARSARAPARPFHDQPLHGFEPTQNGWETYGRPLGTATLYVAQARTERDEALAAVGLASAGTALGVGLLALVLLHHRLKRELRPLQDFSTALRGHDPLAPAATLPAATRAEIAPMHDALAELGQRLQRRLANERAFTAHAAHALRTPLAGLDAQLAVALREAPPPLHPRLARMRQAASRLGRVVSALLTLFRSGVDLQRQPLALAPLLERLPVDGLQIDAAPDACVHADADLLAAALINLLDNALRHGATRLQVTQDGPNGLQLRDNGPGCAPARTAELQAALQAEQYDGHMGLGLMLADIVARAHGGSLRLLPGGPGFGIALDLGP